MSVIKKFKSHKTILTLLLLFIFSRIILEFIGLASIYYSHGSHANLINSQNNINMWCEWDCGWYNNIAVNGYSAQKLDYGQANYAFFPLYPSLMHNVGNFTRSTVLAGFIISNISSFVAIIYFYKLLRIDQTTEDSFKSVKWLIAIPTGLILSAVMTEALFLALLVASFYYARKGKFWIVGLLGFFLTLTRSIGIFMLIPLFFEYLVSIDFKMKNIRADIFSFVMFPIGIFLWMIYNYILIKDPIGFLHIQQAWEKTPILGARKLIGAFIKGDVELLFDLFYLLSCIPLVIWGRKFIRTSYLVLLIIAILIPLPGGIQSMPRYLLIAFPLYILLTKFENKYPQVAQFLLFFFGLLQGFLMVAWGNGYMLLV